MEEEDPPITCDILVRFSPEVAKHLGDIHRQFHKTNHIMTLKDALEKCLEIVHHDVVESIGSNLLMWLKMDTPWIRDDDEITFTNPSPPD
jgi:hypothetical protein